MEYAEATAPFMESGSVRPPSYSSAVAGNGREVSQQVVPGNFNTPPPQYDDEIAPRFFASNQRHPSQGRHRTNSITSTASVLGLLTFNNLVKGSKFFKQNSLGHLVH